MIVYFSNVSGNTKRFVEKLGFPAERIPLSWDSASPLEVDKDFILVTPTYGGGNDNSTVPKQVVKFLNSSGNRGHLKGIIGTGNTNFGEHYCKAAEIISKKTGVPILDRIEIFGTPEDIERVRNKIDKHLPRA